MLINYITFGVYLIILGFITYYSVRNKHADDFLFASHNVKWNVLSLSIFSSIISSYNVVVTLTFSYLFGFYVLIIYLGILAAFIGIYYIAKKDYENIKKLRYGNIIDFLSHKFDSKTTTVFNLSFIIILFLFIIFQFFINTTIFSELMGWNKYISSIVVGLIVLTYMTIGGLKTGIYTDVFQGILMFFIVALVFMVDFTSISSQTVLSMLTDKTILLGSISLAVTQFLTLLVQPEIWQKVISSRSLGDLKKGLTISWIMISLFIIPMIIIGLSARASLESVNPATLFYDVVAASSPEWFMPFLVIALFAAFMSTLDSSLFALTSQLGKYGFVVNSNEIRINDTTQYKVLIKNTRLSIFIVTVLALILSLFLVDFLAAVFGLISLLTVISVVILCSLIFKMTSNQTFIASLVAIIVFLIALFGGFITNEPYTALYPSMILFGYIVVQKLLLQLINR